MSDTQVRYLPIKDFKFRNTENGNPIIEGYFVKFNEIYEICPGWKEKISPGAFSKYLSSGKEIKVLWNHDSNIVLGCRSNATAVFREDDTGLWVQVVLNPKDTDAMNGAARIERRDVTGASFGFDIESVETTYEDDDSILDDIKVVSPLYEVSPCTFPAYEGTDIYARNKQERENKVRDFKKRSFDAWKEKVYKKIKKEGI